MSIDSTVFSNIKFNNVQPFHVESGWNFGTLPIYSDAFSLWNNWSGFSGLADFNGFNLWNNWNLSSGDSDTDFFSGFRNSFTENNKGSGTANFFNFSWAGFKPADNSGFKFTWKKSSSDNSYASMSRAAALEAASKDPNLEKLTGGTGWSVSDSSFVNDIPYAKKGTGAVLEKAATLTGETLVVTSALGTETSPHAKGNSSESHYNSANPKLDLGGGLSLSQAEQLKVKLEGTGLFSRVVVESDGDTAHLDIQIADSAFEKLDTLA